MAEARQIEALRSFNRFYTRRIGVLRATLSGSAFSLPQARLLWELAQRDGLCAAQLARELELDAGYLSRLLRGLRERGLVRAARTRDDARRSALSLTPAGRRAFAPLDEGSRREVGALLDALPAPSQQRLLDSAATLRSLLEPPADPALSLRALRPGDLGWVVGRHGALYAQEYGWDLRFEALVAQIAARFVEQFDPAHEAAWIAERAGVALGCVFLVRCRDERSEPLPGIAQLRLLLVEPHARGSGLGARLVGECSRFARAARYRRVRLWTNSVLGAARRVYEREGYRLVASEPHHSFGQALVGETWELELGVCAADSQPRAAAPRG